MCCYFLLFLLFSLKIISHFFLFPFEINTEQFLRCFKMPDSENFKAWISWKCKDFNQRSDSLIFLRETVFPLHFFFFGLPLRNSIKTFCLKCPNSLQQRNIFFCLFLDSANISFENYTPESCFVVFFFNSKSGCLCKI